jgi:hypothetical protein
MIEIMKPSLVIVALTASIASADVKGPTWTAGPDKAYNCTHYLDHGAAWKDPPRAWPGKAMKLVMRRDKDMKFTLAAKPAKRGGKVTYELENAPAGAKLVGNKFTWKVAGAAGQKYDFALVAIAVGEDAARTKWPITVTVASDDLVTAWSAGLGSVWPDCDVYAPRSYDRVEDLDGDGKDDVVYQTYAGEDGTTETHVKLQRGKMKFVQVHSCFGCSPEPETASDGTRLLVIQDSCCCMETGEIFRFDADTVVSVGSWQESSASCGAPDGSVSVSFERDKKNRITAFVMEDNAGKITRYRWKAKEFQSPH